MKHSAIALTLTLLMSATLSANAARPDGVVDGMASYVYPGNEYKKVATPQWLPDESATVALSEDGKTLVAKSVTDDKEEVILDVATTREHQIERIEGFILSDDASKILVYEGKQSIYRRSFKARWWVFDRHSRILSPLSDDQPLQRTPSFSPDARMVAFVGDDNNIYIKKLDYGTQVAVTTDGRKNSIINGVPDWTYEEEFGVISSMTWAPDNLTLCFLKYNEEQVPMYSMSVFSGACSPNDALLLYPGRMDYKYPVAGQPNSKVTVHSYDIETRKLKQIALPGASVDYIPGLTYAFAPDRLVITTLNRDQNRMEMFVANPRSTTVRSLLVEQNPTGWIEPYTYEDITFLPDFFVVQSSRSGFSQLYQYSYAGAMERRLTDTAYDVTAYCGFDPKTGRHYYQSCAAGPANRSISWVDAKGKTGTVGKPEGTTSLNLSPNATYGFLRFSDVNTPPVYSMVNLAKNRETVIEDNAEYRDRYAAIPKAVFFTVPASGSDPELMGYILRPKDFNPASKHPVIMFQYSGPGSQEVHNSWMMDWSNYFAEQGYIVACVDGRGTGYRGRAFTQVVYKNLGHYETIDQLRAARYVSSLPGVDPARMGIFGWSYGGYETLMCAQAADSPFKAAVAVAPVTDWRFYDTVYAERYMLTPMQNPEGYEQSAPLNHTDNLACPLLIMHGTADDNVHPANTLEYGARLIAGGGLCDMLFFTGMNHSINFCNARLMVYSKMLRFFNNNL